MGAGARPSIRRIKRRLVVHDRGPSPHHRPPALRTHARPQVRFNSRYDRCLLNGVYNGERGVGTQATYAFLDTQVRPRAVA